MPFILPVVAAASAAFAAVGTFVASSAILTSLVTAGIGIAAAYALSSLMPKPSTSNDTTAGGVKFQREYGSDVSRQVACGLIGIAGHDCYVNTFGESNKYLQQVYAVSDYYSTALTRVSIDGAWQTLGEPASDGLAPVLTGEHAGFIFVKFVDGRQTVVDERLAGNSNPVGRWNVNNVGWGISHVIVYMIFDEEKNNSFPDFFFEFKGAPLYDPRKDTSVGGSGPHRWDNVATHEYSNNPMVVEYNYRRGLSVNGDFFCGMDMPASDLPLSKWFSAMNICDEIVDGSPRYQVSIILDCMAQHTNNLSSIAASCGAMQIDAIDGSWPLVGSDQPSVMTFTDDDIISLADFSRTEKRSMAELINSVSGNFPYPEQLWSMIGYEQQVASDYVIIDRRTRDVNIDYPMVPYPNQAARLAWIALYENRYEAVATVTLRPRFQVLESGDWVTWNSALYGVKTFIVTGVQLMSLDSDGPRNAVVSLQERDGRIYEGVTPPPIVVPFPPGEPQYLNEVEDFTVFPVSVVGDGGRAQAAIRASWLEITDPTVSGVQLVYYPVAQPSGAIYKTVPANFTVATLAEGIVGNTDYRVQAKLLTDPLRTTVFNAGEVVKTLDIAIDIGAAITYQVTNVISRLDSKVAEMEAQIAAVASNQNARNWLDKKEQKTTLMSVTGRLTASITEVMTVATDTEQAFADYQLVVNASLDDQYAQIALQATAIANVNGKLVASWSMTTNVNGYISGIKNLNDGTTAAFVIIADQFSIALPSAGLAPKTIFALGTTAAGPNQLVLKADMIVDGAITARMMTVGTLSAITANIGEVTAGIIRSPDSLMIINLTGGRIVFSD